jgi:hypothetical protein
MTPPIWSILIATLDARQAKFTALARGLAAQAAEWDDWRSIHGQLAGAAVEVVALRNNGEHRSAPTVNGCLTAPPANGPASSMTTTPSRTRS